MICPHCGKTDRYELTDGRSRCSGCYATFDVKREKAERREDETSQKSAQDD